MQKDNATKSGFSFGSSVPFGLPISATKDAPNKVPATVSSTETIHRPQITFPAVQPKLELGDMDASGGLGMSATIRPVVVAAKPATTTGRRSTETTRNKLFTFPASDPTLESQWREVEWTEEQKTNLMKTVSSYRPRCEEVTQARVLLLGPVSSGKSSFISSVQSVFSGRVTNRAMVGSSSTSFTKKSFNIRGQKGEDATGLTMCDIMGLGDGEMTGLILHDILSVIKGHVPEGHKFSPDQPVSSETVGYVKRPNLKDKIHCVAFVVDASKILNYPKGLTTTFQQLREHISDLGVHQVALLTHVDKISPETAKDASHVYKSRIIQEMMSKAGSLLGMSTSYIVPVKNYSSELDLDMNTDVLLLSAVDHILQYADLYFHDNTHPKILL